MNYSVKKYWGSWETVRMLPMTLGYAWYDHNLEEPLKRILKSIISTLARGGTYMLNCWGPHLYASIRQRRRNRLRASESGSVDILR